MSGRIRQLKPDFLLDEEFWALKSAHPELHLHEAFEGLWCHADREGRFEWRPQMLKAKILPYWDGDFSRVLEVLAEAGCIVSYVVDGRRYGWVRSFGKHQRPNSREPVSVLPPPSDDALQSSVSVRVHACADESPRASLPPLPIPNTQHPNPSRVSEELPEVPGLELVRPPITYVGLQPSQRDQGGSLPTGARRFNPAWDPSKEHRARGHELGLSDDEMLAEAEDCRRKLYPHGFLTEDDQFFRELGWLAADKAKSAFRNLPKSQRDDFETPGHRRRA